MHEPQHDFKCSVMRWSTSRSRFTSQLETLRTRVQSERLDMIIVLDIPRHHAKKLRQQAWVKDYYISKEPRSVTEKRASIPGTPTPITIAYCRYPFFSEQWFPLEATGPTGPQSLAHISEVCIPLNAWHPVRSPLSLLQEYQLTYDEVSMLTFVIANGATDVEGLRETFAPHKVRNTVIFILPPHLAKEESSVKCGTSKFSVEFQPAQGLWQISPGGSEHTIELVSTLGWGGQQHDNSESE